MSVGREKYNVGSDLTMARYSSTVNGEQYSRLSVLARYLQDHRLYGYAHVVHIAPSNQIKSPPPLKTMSIMSKYPFNQWHFLREQIGQAEDECSVELVGGVNRYEWKPRLDWRNRKEWESGRGDGLAAGRAVGMSGRLSSIMMTRGRSSARL